jgi:hypothetical protein
MYISHSVKVDPPKFYTSHVVLCIPSTFVNFLRNTRWWSTWTDTRCEMISENVCLCDDKVKLSRCLTNQALCHEGVWGSGCIDPHFLDLGSCWRWVVTFTYLLSPRGKSSRYPFDRRLNGTQNPCGLPWEILGPTGTRTPTLRSSNP